MTTPNHLLAWHRIDPRFGFALTDPGDTDSVYPRVWVSTWEFTCKITYANGTRTVVHSRQLVAAVLAGKLTPAETMRGILRIHEMDTTALERSHLQENAEETEEVTP